MHLPRGVVQTGLCAFVLRILRQDASVSCLSVGVMPRFELGLTERKGCAVHSWIERKRLPELRNCGVTVAWRGKPRRAQNARMLRLGCAPSDAGKMPWLDRPFRARE